MRATALVLVTMFALTGVVAAAPSALAYHCGEGGYEMCRLVETTTDIKDHLVYCAKQKPPFLGDSWSCLPNPMI